MNIKICKWYNNADSPVLLMVDDLANVWVDTSGNGKVGLGEDWGYDKNNKNSSYRYLNEVILKSYPNIKTTFFVPLGPRVGMIENSNIKFISKRIDCDEQTKSFFRQINDSPKYEIAYHGTTHGKVGKTTSDFIQEWELYQSLDQAIESINKGKKIYKEVFDGYPKGGKYCGYKGGKYGDESIDQTGFLWWNRYFNKDMGTASKCDIGKDFNPLTNFDIKIFGKNNVIDIPATVYGGMFNGCVHLNINTIKGIAKSILKPWLINKKYKELQYLLNNKLVISIQEHISPARNDSRRQKPNIFDDKESLHMIFEYLKDKNVWYCTGTELAEYYFIRNNIRIIKKNKQFEIEVMYDKKIQNKNITIKISNTSAEAIILPNGIRMKGNKNVYNIPIIDGVYTII
ncbi:hypothetical protein [Crassaminicella profunda]|uniref:hypothetical protein n=1 Tax=Crassaminicella profunda TaxID=1286698 RepID=UPI001CA608D1|nr:hypothetical protein [Crassaminicella profunda]QZY55337.1 hypothetical protein K7H06_20455 [Crassaminicella profunda]